MCDMYKINGVHGLEYTYKWNSKHGRSLICPVNEEHIVWYDLQKGILQSCLIIAHHDYGTAL